MRKQHEENERDVVFAERHECKIDRICERKRIDKISARHVACQQT